MGENVYIIGVGMIRFGKHFEKSIKVMTGEALKLVLDDCDLSQDKIEAAWFSNSGWGISAFQHCIRGQVALSANGLDKIPVTNVENACAGGSTALHSGWTAIKAGIYDCVLAIGTEKQYFASSGEGRSKTMQGFIAGTDVEETNKMIEKWMESEKNERRRPPKKPRRRESNLSRRKKKVIQYSWISTP